MRMQFSFRNQECRYFGGLQNQALDQREDKFTDWEISFHFWVHAFHRRCGNRRWKTGLFGFVLNRAVRGEPFP